MFIASHFSVSDLGVSLFNNEKYSHFLAETIFSKNSASRQSLPNMHMDTESTEDSTESLIDESEECVRKSIDTTLTLIDGPCLGYRYVGRTFSVPNLFLGIIFIL